MAMSNETANLAQRDRSNFFVRFFKYFVPWKGDKSNEIVRKIAFCASIVLFSMSIDRLAGFLGSTYEEQKSYIQEVVDEYEPQFDDNVNYEENKGEDDSPDAEAPEKEREIQQWVKDSKLLERNEDVVGWIKIPGFTDYQGREYINFPVLQGEDNDYYLHNNIDREYYESGSIFIDYGCEVTPVHQCSNLTIYGHHMGYVGTSFTHLSEYERGVDFLKQYPIIEFNSIYESGNKYAVVACFMANTEPEDDNEPLFEYIGYKDFDIDGFEFDKWYNEITRRSWYSSDIECTEDDMYITLSTCSKYLENLRWVIVAKKLTPDDNIDKIIRSYKDKADIDVYFPKCWRDIYGNNKQYKGWEY